MYKHGVYNTTADTEISSTVSNRFAQIVIGTAPVHLLSDPQAAVNKPVLCESITDCNNKIGYLEDFDKYTLCQSMYTSFKMMKVSPVVFINVLDPQKHFIAKESTEYTVNDNAIIIDDSVIVSTLVIKKEEVAVEAERYIAEWVDGKLIVNFAEPTEGTVTVEYNAIDPSKVTTSDIIGEWDTETDKRTGSELIKSVFPSLGVVPFIITAPGWTTDDTVGAVLASKAPIINGCYKGMVIDDIDSTEATTRAGAIEAKKNRTLDENCIAVYPAVKKNDKIIAYSAVLSALIMYQATTTGGITCKSPSNQKISVDDVCLADGTSIYYDQEDGNELNAEGIVTVISRNGWYTWGNSTAAYPETTDPVKRWIMTRLSFLYIENDFINSHFASVDGAINKKLVENIITEENIKLASYAAAGYIASGKISYNAGDNPDEEILNGHFTFRTSLAANIPSEVIENKFSFDMDALKNAITGGEQ